MNCQQAQEWISLAIDEMLPAEEQEQLAAHCQDCDACRALVAAGSALHASFSQMALPEVPDHFACQLRQRLTMENNEHPRRQPIYLHKWFKGIAAAACLMLLFGLSGVWLNFSAGGADTKASDAGGSANGWATEETTSDMPSDSSVFLQEDSVAADDVGLDADTQEYMTQEGVSASQSTEVLERKIIQDVYLQLKVEDFDEAYQKLNDLAQQYGGYTVSGEVYTNENDIATSGFISLRVEADSLSQALSDIQQLGAITERQFHTDDVTYEYYDTQSRLEQYEKQKTRLLDFYQKAESIEDLLALEQELNRVQMELDALQGTMNYYDQLTALSLISINLYTPSRYDVAVEPRGFAGFWRDVQEAFLNGVNGALDFCAGLLLFIVRLFPLWLVLALALAFIFRRRRKNRLKQDGQNGV